MHKYPGERWYTRVGTFSGQQHPRGARSMQMQYLSAALPALRPFEPHSIMVVTRLHFLDSALPARPGAAVAVLIRLPVRLGFGP